MITTVAPVGQALPPMGLTVNVVPSPVAMSIATGAPLTVAVMCAAAMVHGGGSSSIGSGVGGPQGAGSTKLVNATIAGVVAISSVSMVAGMNGLAATTTPLNGAIVNTSVPPWSRPLPVNGVVPSLARTRSACRLTVMVVPEGNSGCGAENRLGPLPR